MPASDALDTSQHAARLHIPFWPPSRGEHESPPLRLCGVRCRPRPGQPQALQSTPQGKQDMPRRADTFAAVRGCRRREPIQSLTVWISRRCLGSTNPHAGGRRFRLRSRRVSGRFASAGIAECSVAKGLFSQWSNPSSDRRCRGSFTSTFVSLSLSVPLRRPNG